MPKSVQKAQEKTPANGVAKKDKKVKKEKKEKKEKVRLSF